MSPATKNAAAGEEKAADLPEKRRQKRLKALCFPCQYAYPDLLFDGTRVLAAWLNNTKKFGLTKEIRGTFACRVDLSAETVGFRSQCGSCHRRRPLPSCTARAELLLRNSGIQVLQSAWIDLFLSEDPSLGAGDLPLTRHRVGEIGPRSSARVLLGARLPPGAGAPGKHLLASIGVDLPEADCGGADNVVWLGRIPSPRRR